MIKPFSETSLNELNNSDPFYLTGSLDTFGTTPGDFSNKLDSKERIKVSFDVRNKSRMLPNSSSIYYFNLSTGMWNIPTRSLGDHTGPFHHFAVNTGGATTWSNGSSFVEDRIMFDYKGNALASGSVPIYRASNSASEYQQKLFEESWIYTSTNSALSFDSQGDFMARSYPASAQRNTAYDAADNETFTLPIQYPFLIEKVVLEIPFCFGTGWFNDRTTLDFMTSSFLDYRLDGVGSMDGDVSGMGIIDQGGPCITVSLMSQKNYGTGSIRDLICKTRVTHTIDTSGSFDLRELFPETYTYGGGPSDLDYYSLSISGLKTGSYDSVVSPTISGTSKYFTGSVVLKSIPSITNGCSAINASYGFTTGPSVAYDNFLKNKFSKEYFSPGLNTFDESLYLYGIDTFGRGQTGFAPSGGSIFGGEHSSLDQDLILPNNFIKNNFYIQDETLRSAVYTSISSSILTGRNFSTNRLVLVSITDIHFAKDRESPYLINPGEKLILSVSKTRPAHRTFKVNVDTVANPNARIYGLPTHLSSSFQNSIPTNLLPGHDVQFNTGSINITFYGSYVQNGNRYIP